MCNFSKGLKKLKTLWPLFMDRVQLPQCKSHFKEAVYFLPLSPLKFLVLILLTSEVWKAGSNLSNPVVLNSGPLDWESSALTTRPLLYNKLILLISKSSPNEFYNYATFIDILQYECHYIVLQILVWKWHFDTG